MLRKLTLRCFRQHESRTFTFTEGLNLLRGPNEGGKTTILEAVTYAIGGAVALPESLDKVVTWDHKESELAVELDITIAGVDYSVKRSKSGATLTSPSLEKPVTGQKEVSAFFASLLGGSAKTLSMLLMASQNGLQDVITAGPGEVSQLVQKLGSLDIVDAVISTAKTELILGNEKVFADRVASAQARVTAHEGQQVAEVDMLEAERFVSTAVMKREEADKTVSTLWEPAMAAAASNLNAGIARNDLVQNLAAQSQKVMEEMRRLRANIAQAERTPKPDLSEKVGLEQEITRIENARRAVMVKERITTLMAVKRPMEWDAATPDGDAEAEVRAELATAKRAADEARDLAMQPIVDPNLAVLQNNRALAQSGDPFKEEIAQAMEALDAPIMAQEYREATEPVPQVQAELIAARRIVSAGIAVQGEKCPTCGQAFADAAARAEHNRQEQARIDAAKARITELEAELAALKGKLDIVTVARDKHKTEWAGKLEELQRRTLAWRREKVAAIDADIAAVNASVDGLRNTRRAAFNKAAEYQVTLVNLLDSGMAAQRMADELAGQPNVKVNRAVFPPRLSFEGVIDIPERSESEIRRILSDIDVAQGNYDRAQGMIAGLKDSLATQEKAFAENDARHAAEAALLPDMTALRAEYDRVVEGIELARAEREKCALEVRDCQNRLDSLKDRKERAASQLKLAQMELELAQKELAELAFNNEAMKTFQGLKPLVTEYMWSKSLAAISHYFSDLRDQVVKVTREGSEFMFNGRPASSLSGSGKDVLAIAIRSALTKTFLPNVGFISLDEPAHGSDEVRTSRILGFLAKSGFVQIILASHDPLSESVADNIIYVQEQ